MEASQWPQRAYHPTFSNIYIYIYMVTDFQKGLLATRVVFSCNFEVWNKFWVTFSKKRTFHQVRFAGCFSSSMNFSKVGTMKITSKSRMFQCGELWRFRFRPPHVVKHAVWQQKKRFQLCSSQSLQEKTGHTNQIGSKNFKIHGNPPISINTFYPFFVSSTSFRKKKLLVFHFPMVLNQKQPTHHSLAVRLQPTTHRFFAQPTHRWGPLSRTIALDLLKIKMLGFQVPKIFLPA